MKEPTDLAIFHSLARIHASLNNTHAGGTLTMASVVATGLALEASAVRRMGDTDASHERFRLLSINMLCWDRRHENAANALWKATDELLRDSAALTRLAERAWRDEQHRRRGGR